MHDGIGRVPSGRPTRLPPIAAITLLLILGGTARMVWADSYARTLSFPDQDLQVADGWPGLWPASVPSDSDVSSGPPSDRLAYRGDRPRQNDRGAWVDPNLQSPRTWYIQDLWHRLRTVTTIVEQENLCLDPYFYWPVWSFTGDLYQDNWYFYSRKSLLTLAASIGGAAALANTSADQQVRDWLQEHVATDKRNWEWAKFFGEPWIIPPLLLTVWAIDQWAPPYGLFREFCWNPELGLWSRQSLRALAVGAPVVLALQYLTGASRPGEASYGSHWRPFRDNNGVSGHAFVGAVPFLVAARRTDNLLLKSAFLAGSSLAGFSRLNDDAHYLSQVLLGWSIACLAVQATEWTEQSQLQYRIVPLTIDGYVGVGVEARY